MLLLLRCVEALPYACDNTSGKCNLTNPADYGIRPISTAADSSAAPIKFQLPPAWQRTMHEAAEEACKSCSMRAAVCQIGDCGELEDAKPDDAGKFCWCASQLCHPQDCADPVCPEGWKPCPVKLRLQRGPGKAKAEANATSMNATRSAGDAMGDFTPVNSSSAAGATADLLTLQLAPKRVPGRSRQRRRSHSEQQRQQVP